MLYFFSAGFMTWEIAHNIDSLLVKDRKIGAGFDLTVNVSEEDSNPNLAECIRGMCNEFRVKCLGMLTFRRNSVSKYAPKLKIAPN